MTKPAPPAAHEHLADLITGAVFARNVRVALVRRDMTVDDLAAAIKPEGVHPTWVRRRLSLETATSLNDLDRIAAALGTTALVLITPSEDRDVYIPGGER